MYRATDSDSPASVLSSSSSSSSIHHASLVDPANHSAALLELVDVKVSRPVINYVVDRVVDTVDFALGKSLPSSSRGRSATRRPEHVKFTTFVSDVVSRAEVTMPTLLASLVYIERARPHLHISLEQWALERVFLGALIVASKYLNDSTLKNVHWAMCTGVFGKRDVGRIEREYLDVLNFELKITEDDLLSHREGLMKAVSPPRHKESEPPKYSTTTTVHVHTERRHPHRRNAIDQTLLPELSPASDSSSSSSSIYSPRTPSDDAMEVCPPESTKPSVLPHSKEPAIQLPSNRNVRNPFSDLLRSFPTIPRMSSSS